MVIRTHVAVDPAAAEVVRCDDCGDGEAGLQACQLAVRFRQPLQLRF